MKKIAYVGVDYHLDVVTIASAIEGTKKIYETIRLKNNDKLMAKYLKKISEKFELKLCYEASSSGYSFQRKVRSWGYHCDVIAPAVIPKKPGERRKNGLPGRQKTSPHVRPWLVDRCSSLFRARGIHPQFNSGP